MNKSKLGKPLTLLLLTGAVFLFLKYIAPLVAPVLLAMLFVTIFGNTLKKLQARLHIHRQIGALLLLVLATLLLVLLVWILFSWGMASLPDWLDRLDYMEKEITVIVRRSCEAMGRVLRLDSVYLEEFLLGSIQDGIDYFQVQVIPGMLSQSLVYLKGMAVLGAFLVTFIIASVLLAKDYDSIMNRLLDRKDCHVLLEVICGVIRYIATFVRAQAVIVGILAGLCALVLGFAKVSQGILWGIVAGVLDLLPFVGTGVVLLPLAAIQAFRGSYGRAVVCLLLYVACIFVREFLEPRLIGKEIGVSPIAVLVSLYAGIQLFGMGGIILGPLGFVIIHETYRSLYREKESVESG